MASASQRPLGDREWLLLGWMVQKPLYRQIAIGSGWCWGGWPQRDLHDWRLGLWGVSVVGVKASERLIGDRECLGG